MCADAECNVGLPATGGGEGFAPSQIHGGKFRCGKFRGAPWILCGTPRQSPECVLLVCKKFAENPEFCVGNFAVNLKREISYAKLKCHNPPLCDIPSGCCSFTGPWTVTRSSLRMLRRVATCCRPLRPVLLLVSFPRSRSPIVGVLGLC